MAAAGVGGLLVAKDALANINWDKKFKDTFADFKFPEFDLKDMNMGTGSNSAIGGEKAGNWKNDSEFMNKVNKFADEKGIKASDLLAVMASESGMDPSIKNPKSKAVGLIQFMPKTAGILGTSTEELEKMTRSEQFEYVKKFFDKTGGLKQGATAGDMYAQMYLPSRKNDAILTKKGEDYYESNKEFDVGNKGYITKEDLQQRAERKKKEFDIKDVQTTKKVNPQESVTINESTGDVTIKKIAEGSGIESYGTMKPEGIVFHHTGGDSLQGAMATMRDKKKYGYQQATQYVIDKDGSIYQLQSDTAITYHAGTKPGQSKFGNWNSIGVEVVAPNSEKFTPAQMDSSFKLGKFLSKKYGIPYSNIVGHGEISKDKMASEGKPIAQLFRETKLSSVDAQYPELNGVKKINSNGQQVSILNNNTNIIGGGTTYLISQENVSTYSPVTQQQFNYLS
jgi:N-acetyl-anhydromuramyl-L-alanine amidase AmpD